MKSSLLAVTFIYLLAVGLMSAANGDSVSNCKKSPDTPPLVRSLIGDSSTGVHNSLKLINIGKVHQLSPSHKGSYDTDIYSPKSVTFSADGSLFYINSLEGCKTLVYDTRTMEKKHVIEHSFDSSDTGLWADASGHYPFKHYSDGNARPFKGKPVESTWSHNKRYLWIPYYRRSFDLNAQEPSALAVVDTESHSIVRLFETGPLPKMVASSPDGKWLAITHWGDNTVGLIDISSDSPSSWHHVPPVTVGHKLKLDFPLDSAVNRDANSGFLLRGTVFTPDSRYLLVSGMAGPMAVIDVETLRTIGTVERVYGVRHLVIHNSTVYGSKNYSGEVISFPVDSLMAAVRKAENSRSHRIQMPGKIRSCKVSGGARTLDISPDGKYIFVACNSGSAINVVETSSMKIADSIRCDSYPVGLALSNDGRRLIVTSQGRKGKGGNSVNIFEVRRQDLPETVPMPELECDSDSTVQAETPPSIDTGNGNSSMKITWITVAVLILALTSVIIIRRHSSK